MNCLKTQEALDLLRYCLDDGEVRLGKHFRDELQNENLEFEDALPVLQSGAIYDPPEFDIKSGEWKYKVEGYEPGGKWLVIVLSFKAENMAFLITIWSVERRRKGSQR